MNEDGNRQRLRDICIHTLETKRANGSTWLQQLKCMEVPYLGEGEELFDVSQGHGVSMYRMYNKNSGEHFYTGDPAEKALITANVIKLRGTSKSPCIRNGAGGIFFQKRVDIKAEKCGRFRY